MRPLAEALGVLLVVAGLCLAWLPLGLIAAGLALVLAAHAPAPSETDPDLVGSARGPG
jgi:hypothetical protein